MPKASMFERVARATLSSVPAGCRTPVNLTGSSPSDPNGTTSSISKSTASPIRTAWRSPSSCTSMGARWTPRFSPTSGPSACIGPPSAPENTAPSLSACSSEAAASMNTPRRQFPSLITLGVSATAATARPLTSVPSTSPLLTLNTSVTRQRSWVALSANEAVHGHTTSHEQVSKYDPSSFQDMKGLLVAGERGKGDSLQPAGRGSTARPVLAGPRRHDTAAARLTRSCGSGGEDSAAATAEEPDHRAGAGMTGIAGIAGVDLD